MRSSMRAALAAVVASVALLGTLGAGASAATAATPAASSVTAQKGILTTTRFGMSYGERLSRMSRADLDEALDDAVLVGVRWIRMDLSWTTIQPDGPGTYRWAAFDRVVNGARARGLKVLPILTWTPDWARDAGCKRFSCPPHSASQFARFAKAAVKRYQPKGVRIWEVWNEPNLDTFWPNPNPTRYAALLKTTYAAIRSVDARAQVLLGGLSALENRAPSIGPRQFLTSVCRAGGCRAMDGVSYHPYTFPFIASYDAGWSAWSKINQTDWNLRGILDQFGFPRKRIWVTEYGAPTKGLGTAADGRWDTITPLTTHVTEAWQAVIATDVVAEASRNKDVAALFWYTNQDLAVTDLRESSFGLRRLDGVPKPAWATFGTAVKAASLG